MESSTTSQTAAPHGTEVVTFAQAVRATAARHPDIVAVRTPTPVGVKATHTVQVVPEVTVVPVTQPPDGGKDSAKSEVLVPVNVARS